MPRTLSGAALSSLSLWWPSLHRPPHGQVIRRSPSQTTRPSPLGAPTRDCPTFEKEIKMRCKYVKIPRRVANVMLAVFREQTREIEKLRKKLRRDYPKLFNQSK